jgi:hypothetical protein
MFHIIIRIQYYIVLYFYHAAYFTKIKRLSNIQHNNYMSDNLS